MAFEAKPFCERHQKMGVWKVIWFYEDLGGFQSPVDDRHVIVCEDC